MSKVRPASLPHSWSINDWPVGVHPNRSSTARYLVRAHKDELLAVGALTRVGRELVILGEGYARFLARQMQTVPGFTYQGRSKRTPTAPATPQG
jgi:hypothetical protein